jgi:hypothetical protein
MIQIKLVGMFMTYYNTKVHLSKCNGSRVVSTKQTMNFSFKLPPCPYIFLFFTKMVILKVVNPLKFYPFSKFHGPTFTGASFASTSEV